MLNQVQNFIIKESLLQPGERVIFACSGGKDSMVLLDVMNRLGYEVVVAHCNYQLRAEESNQDEEFIAKKCQQLKFRFHSVRFDTLSLSKQKKKPIQELARDLRYQFLEELRQKEDARVIITAHHLQDNIETMMFKLSKGTGIRGMRGILPKNGHLVRPMLQVSMEDIQAYISAENIEFREDSSNAKDDYDRNKIRHHILEPMRQINPKLEGTFSTHFQRWRDIEQMHGIVLDYLRQKLLKEKRGSYFISIKELQTYGLNKTLLFELLRPYGFNISDIEDISGGLCNTSTKEYLSEDFRLLKDRKFLVITSRKDEAESAIYTITKNKRKIQLNSQLQIQFQYKPKGKLSKINKGNNYAYIDMAKLEYPLVLRRWESGDYFYPLGLQKASGKPSKKNIGKFLRDEKVGAFDKENTWVITSNQKVVWLVGYRLDDRFKISHRTQDILKIALK